MPSGFNGIQYIQDIPAGAGVPITPILAKGPCRRLTVTESLLTSTGTANAPVGLNYSIPNDGTTNGFTTVFPVNPPSYGASDTPTRILLGDGVGDLGPFGSLLGNGPSVLIGIGATPAITLCKVAGAGGAATSVLVRQDY